MAKQLQPSSTNYVRHQLCISPYSPDLTIFQVLQLLTKTRHTQDSSQILMAESIQPGFITLQQRPAFRAIQKKRRGAAAIQHLLDLSREFWVPENTLQRTKCFSGICKATINLPSSAGVWRASTAQIYKQTNSLYRLVRYYQRCFIISRCTHTSYNTFRLNKVNVNAKFRTNGVKQFQCHLRRCMRCGNQSSIIRKLNV